MDDGTSSDAAPEPLLAPGIRLEPDWVKFCISRRKVGRHSMVRASDVTAYSGSITSNIRPTRWNVRHRNRFFPRGYVVIPQRDWMQWTT